MPRYRKISTCIWGDDKVLQLSRPKRANGRDLWFYLLTGPHTTSLPGLFRSSVAVLAEEHGWRPGETAQALQEVIDLGMARYDPSARVIWLPKANAHNEPASPNVVRGGRPHFDELPPTPLKGHALAGIRRHLEAREPAGQSGKGFLKAFREAFPEAFPEAFVVPGPKPSPKARPNQEQEQEQEPNERRTPALAGRSFPQAVEK